jgi:hypothetical protein
MADFSVKQGDTAPAFTDTLTYSDGSTVNLAGSAVQFVMRTLWSALPQVQAAATITNPTNPATVSYTPTAVDSAIPGAYMGNWIVTFSSGAVMTFPTVGYLSIEVEENLVTPGGQQLVSLADVKNYLNIPAGDRSRDFELTMFIGGTRRPIEAIVRHVIPEQFDEWYDGGNYFVDLLERPVLSLQAVTEFRGPVQYDLSIIADPVHGSIYSCQLDRDRVVRRSSGGGVISFPDRPQSVHVVYTAGRLSMPDHIRLGTLEMIRENWQQTQQLRPGAWGGATDQPADAAPPSMLVSKRVREILVSSRRHPSVR